MLEHADRDDRVEGTLDLAVVLEEEADAVVEAALLGAAVGDGVLLFRQRHTGHVDAAAVGEVEAEPAPARADVEHLHAGLEHELGGEVALLGKLRRFEIGLVVFEIGAGILLVAVEEERIEPAVEVVVMGDVPPCTPGGVELAEAAGEEAEIGADLHQEGRVASLLRIDEDRLHEVIDRAGFEIETAVHELLAELQPGIEDDVPLGARPVELEPDWREGAVAVSLDLAGGVDDLDRSLADGPLEETVEKPVHCVPWPTLLTAGSAALSGPAARGCYYHLRQRLNHCRAGASTAVRRPIRPRRELRP